MSMRPKNYFGEAFFMLLTSFILAKEFWRFGSHNIFLMNSIFKYVRSRSLEQNRLQSEHLIFYRVDCTPGDSVPIMYIF